MPVVTKDLVLTGGNVREFITIPTERHIIYAVTAYNLYQGGGLAQMWAQVGIMSGGQAYQHKISTFASGYITKSSDLGWTGYIPTDPDQFIFGEVYGPIGLTFRLSAILYKIITDDKGRFHADW